MDNNRNTHAILYIIMRMRTNPKPRLFAPYKLHPVQQAYSGTWSQGKHFATCTYATSAPLNARHSCNDRANISTVVCHAIPNISATKVTVLVLS